MNLQRVEKVVAAKLSVVLFLATALCLLGGCQTDSTGGSSTSTSRAESAKNIEAMMKAVEKYVDEHKRYPGSCSVAMDGRPLLSWRVHLLPYLGHEELYKKFNLDEPWDSDHNKELLSEMPSVFLAPASKAGTGKTVYRGNGGPYAGLLDIPFKPGMHQGIKQGAVLDGTSNTIMIIETTDALAVEWTRPAALAMGNFEITDLFGTYPDGTNAGFGDFSVKFVSDVLTHQLIAYLLHRNDAHDLKTLPQMVEKLKSQRETQPQYYGKQYREGIEEFKKQFLQNQTKKIDYMKWIIVTNNSYKLKKADTDAQIKSMEENIKKLGALRQEIKKNRAEGWREEFSAKKEELEKAEKDLAEFKSNEAKNRQQAALDEVEKYYDAAWSDFYSN